MLEKNESKNKETDKNPFNHIVLHNVFCCIQI